MLPRPVRAFLLGRQVFRDTFETPSGRMALAQIRHLCGCDSDQRVFSKDPLVMAANARGADIYREITRYLRLNDDDIDRAAKQALERVGEDL